MKKYYSLQRTVEEVEETLDLLFADDGYLVQKGSIDKLKSAAVDSKKHGLLKGAILLERLANELDTRCNPYNSALINDLNRLKLYLEVIKKDINLIEHAIEG